jgi:hypothetical protein
MIFFKKNPELLISKNTPNYTRKKTQKINKSKISQALNFVNIIIIIIIIIITLVVVRGREDGHL